MSSIRTDFSDYKPSVSGSIKLDFSEYGAQAAVDQARAEEAKTVPETAGQYDIWSSKTVEEPTRPIGEWLGGYKKKEDKDNILSSTDKALIKAHNILMAVGAGAMEGITKIPNPFTGWSAITDFFAWGKDAPTFEQATKEREFQRKTTPDLVHPEQRYTYKLSDDDIAKQLWNKTKAEKQAELGEGVWNYVPGFSTQALIDYRRAQLETEAWAQGREPISDVIRTFLKNNAQALRDKILYDPDSTKTTEAISDAVAGGLSAAPGIINFMLGWLPAFTDKATEAQNRGLSKVAQAVHGMKGVGEWAALKWMFGAMHPMAEKFGVKGQILQAVGGGTVMAGEGLVSPTIDKYLDKTGLSFIPGFKITDIDDYNEHLNNLKRIADRKWIDFGANLVTGSFLSISPKPPAGFKTIPKKEWGTATAKSRLFGSGEAPIRTGSMEKDFKLWLFGGKYKTPPSIEKYLDQTNKEYLDMQAIEQGLLFSDKGDPVVIYTPVYNIQDQFTGGRGGAESGQANFISDIAEFFVRGTRMIQSPDVERAVIFDRWKQQNFARLPSVDSIIGFGITDAESSKYEGKILKVSVATSPSKGHVPWSIPIDVEYIGKHDGKHTFVYNGMRYSLEDRHFRLVSDTGKPSKQYSRTERDISQEDINKNPKTLFITNNELVNGANKVTIPDKLKDIEAVVQSIKTRLVNSGKEPVFTTSLPVANFADLLNKARTGIANINFIGEEGGVVRIFAQRGEGQRPATGTVNQQFNALSHPPKTEEGTRKFKDFVITEILRVDKSNIEQVKEIIKAPSYIVQEKYLGQYVFKLEPLNKIDNIRVDINSFIGRKDSDYLYSRLNDLLQFMDNRTRTPKELTTISDVRDGKLHKIIKEVGHTDAGETIYYTEDKKFFTERGYELTSTMFGMVKPIQKQKERRRTIKGFDYTTSGKDPLYSSNTFPDNRINYNVKGLSYQDSRYQELGKTRTSAFQMILTGDRTGHIVGATEGEAMEIGDIIPIEYARYSPTKKDQYGNSRVEETAILYVKITGKEKLLKSDLGKNGLYLNQQTPDVQNFLQSLSKIEGISPDYLTWYYNQKSRNQKVWNKGYGYLIKYELVKKLREFPFYIDEKGKWHFDETTEVAAKGYKAHYLKPDITEPIDIQELTSQSVMAYERARRNWQTAYDRQLAREYGKAGVWARKLVEQCYDLYTDIPKIEPALILEQSIPTRIYSSSDVGTSNIELFKDASVKRREYESKNIETYNVARDSVRNHITSIMSTIPEGRLKEMVEMGAKPTNPEERLMMLLAEGMTHGYGLNDVINMASANIQNKISTPHMLTLLQFIKGNPGISVSTFSERESWKPGTNIDPSTGIVQKSGQGYKSREVEYGKPTVIENFISPPETESAAKLLEQVYRRMTTIDVPTEHGFYETILGGELFTKIRAEHMRAVDKAFANGEIDAFSDIAKIHYLTYPEIYWKHGGEYRKYLSSLVLGKESKEIEGTGKKYKSITEAYTKEFGEETIGRITTEAEKAEAKFKESIGEGEEPTYEKVTDEDTRQARQLQSIVSTHEAMGADAGMLDFTGLIDYFSRKFKPSDAIYATNHNIFELLKKHYTGAIKDEDRIRALELYEFCKATTANIIETADRLTGKTGRTVTPEQVAKQIFMKYFDEDQSSSLARIYTETEYKHYMLRTQLDDIIQEAGNVILTTKRTPAKGEWWKEFKEDTAHNKNRIAFWANNKSKAIYNTLAYYPRVPPYARYTLRQSKVDIDQIDRFANNIMTLTDQMSHAEERLALDWIQYGAEYSRLKDRRGEVTEADYARLEKLQKINDDAIEALPKGNKVIVRKWIKTMQGMLNKVQSYLVDVGDLKDYKGDTRVFDYYAPLKAFPYYTETFRGVHKYTMPRSIKTPAQTYTFATKGLKEGQRYLPLTTYDLVDHLCNVRYDIIMKENVKKLTTAYDINEFVGDNFKRIVYGEDVAEITDIAGVKQGEVKTIRDWGKVSGEFFKGSDIMKMMQHGDRGDSSKINPDKYYKIWSPDWKNEVLDYDPIAMDMNNGIPQTKGYKKTFLLEVDIADALDSINPLPYSGFWNNVNWIDGMWKKHLLLTIYPKYLTGNHIGDMILMAYFHPEARQAFKYMGQARKLLFRALLENHPNGKIWYEKHFGKWQPTDKEMEDLEIARSSGILDAGLMNDILSIMSKNKFSRALNSVSEFAQGREAWLRLMNTMWMMEEYRSGRGEQLASKFSWLPNIKEAQDLDGKWNQMKLIGHIGRTLSIDYMRKSPGYSRYISGFAAPFGKFYIDASIMATRYLTQGWKGKTAGEKMKFAMKSLGSLFALPVMAEVGNIIVESLMDEDYVEERRRVEASLHPGIRQRTHFIMGKKEDGSWMTWIVPNPFDLLFVTKMPAQIVSLANKLRTGELQMRYDNAHKVLLDFFKDYGLSEIKSAAYLMGPWLRFFQGLYQHRDPYDGTPIARTTDWSQLGGSETAWVLVNYMAKCMIPWMATYTVNIENKNNTITGGALDFVKDFADVAEWVGIRWRNGRSIVPPSEGYTETPGGGIMYTQRKVAEQLRDARGMVENISRAMMKDWIRTGLDEYEFLTSDQYEEYEKQYIKAFNKFIGDEDKAEEYFRQHQGMINKLFLKRARDPEWRIQYIQAKKRNADPEDLPELNELESRLKYERGVEVKKKMPRASRDLESFITQGLVGGGD